MGYLLAAVMLAFVLGACGDATGQRPSATAPRDWAARHNEVTGAPRLERRDSPSAPPTLAPAPTTPETRELGSARDARPQ
jgi:hypothetical protein